MNTVNDLASKTNAELSEELKKLYREQFRLRLTKSSGELTQTHKVKQVRQQIARILTLLNINQGK